MTRFEKAAYAVAAGIALLIVGLAVAYWWAGQIPSRPKGVAANAVFLWAPHVGLPGARRGWWLSCWDDAGHDRCKLSDVHGNTEYEGEFVQYGNEGSVPADQLNIDPEKTSDNKVWVGSALVPLVFLQNGKVLIPATKYEEGVQLLQGVKSNQ
jgi:hypothetical protein